MTNPTGFGLFLDVLQVLIRRKRFILSAVFFPTLASIVIVLLSESVYKSEALVNPPKSEAGGIGALQNLSGVGSELGALFGGGGSGLDDCVSILNSARFADLTIARFDLETEYGFKKKGNERKVYKADVIKTFRKRASFMETDEDAIKISMKDTSAVKAKEMLSYMIFLLDSLYTDVQKSASQQRLGYIDQRLQLVEADMERLEDSLVAFQTRHNFLAPEEQLRMILQNATQTELRLETIKEAMGLEAALRGTTSARYRDLAIERDLLEKTLAGRINNRSGVNSFIQPTNKLPALATEYFRLDRAYTIRVGVYKFLTQQAEMLKLEAGKNIRVISVIDPPWVDDKRISPKRRVVVQSVFALSLILSIFLVVLYEAWNRHKARHPESNVLARNLRKELFRF